MTEAYLGFGSNIGSKVGNIRRATSLLRENGRIHKLELSPFYKSDPVGKTDQDWFVNAAARLETDLTSTELLDLCLGVEKTLGRERIERWGPRIIDIDLLLFGEEEIRREGLVLPHPRIGERAFVLQPLLDLEPNLVIGDDSCAALLEGLDPQGIEGLDPVVAILGASEKPDRYANKAQKLLVEKGFSVQPIARRGDEILGRPVLRRLLECKEPVDTLTLYVGSTRLPELLPEILQVFPRRVIFNPGTENEYVKAKLEAAGIETIEACTLVMLTVGTFYSAMM